MLVDEIPKHRHGKIVCSMDFLLRHIPERKFTTASTPSTTRPDLPGLVDVEHVTKATAVAGVVSALAVV